ncbi:MAG: hypothetical protein VX726_07710 [Planctomycetota bacterium]|nr:hypothetical protein [Planctomycetota bacterium]MEE2895614.1 hypothetical protein [Planctomycetota bacterium]
MSDRRFIDRLRHAFAVEDPEDFAPTDREREAVEKICREVVRRRMTTPATMLLEMSRPLNYLGAQALHFFTPFASTVVDPDSWNAFASFVERRGSVEYLIRSIEDAEASHVESDPAENAPSPPADGASRSPAEPESNDDPDRTS